ncbi:MAG TPA: hypothetical protein VGM16_09695 [Gammaproteobacteria bacterium]|jgi:hypothetical protein
MQRSLVGFLALISMTSTWADAPASREVTPAPAAVTGATVSGTVAAHATQFTWALDPYDSNLAYDFPLGDKPIPVIHSEDPSVLFRALMEDSLLPHYMYVQADVYPLPMLGTWLKSHSPHTYKKADLQATGVNLIESSTTSYQEPWALSVFLGNIADLQRPGESQGANNVGYSGWLVSGGTQHLKDNVLIQDDWYRLEWQVRGDLKDPVAKFSWDFRVGSKFNANPYVTDVVYLGLERDDLDFRKPFLSWLDNSSLDLQAEFSQHGGHVVRETLVMGKKYPFPEAGYALTLSVGVVWDGVGEYSGPLRDSPKSQYTLVFQPSIQF